MVSSDVVGSFASATTTSLSMSSVVGEIDMLDCIHSIYVMLTVTYFLYTCFDHSVCCGVVGGVALWLWMDAGHSNDRGGCILVRVPAGDRWMV